MITQAIFLSVVIKSLVDAVSAPLKNKFPNHDFWYLYYVALLLGAIVGWFSQINLLADYIPNEIAGRVLTSVLIGGGASLIHDVFEGILVTLNKPPVQLQYSTESKETPADKVAKEQILEQVTEQNE